MNDDTNPNNPGAAVDDKRERLATGADALADRTPITQRRNLLLVVSAIMMTAGFTAIVLGWIGTANSTIVEEQNAYVVSGGLLGTALAVVGAVVYFAHWLTILVRQNHDNQVQINNQHDELLNEMRLLRSALTAQAKTNGARPAARSSQRS